MATSLTFRDGNFIRFQEVADILGDDRANVAFRRGLNRVGNSARTHTIRAAAKQVGLTQKKVREFGGIKTIRASNQNLTYTIQSTGRHISLKEFGARQFSYGVKAKPWGNQRRFEGTFIFAGGPNSGRFVAGGHVFHRTSAASYPIEMMFGPAIPRELIKDESAKAFEDKALDLPKRIAHEVSVLTRGLVD